MSDAYFTASAKSSKPYPKFPLFPRATGRWCNGVKANDLSQVVFPQRLAKM